MSKDVFSRTFSSASLVLLHRLCVPMLPGCLSSPGCLWFGWHPIIAGYPGKQFVFFFAGPKQNSRSHWWGHLGLSCLRHSGRHCARLCSSSVLFVPLLDVTRIEIARLKPLGKHDSGLLGGTYILGAQQAWQTSGEPLKWRRSFLSPVLSALLSALLPNKRLLNLSVKGTLPLIAPASVLFCYCCLNEETKAEF